MIPPSSPSKSVRDYTISMPWSIQTSGMDSVNLARALNVNLELREPAESGFDLRKDGRIRFSGAGLVQCRFCPGGPDLPQGPGGVGADQRLGVLSKCPGQGRDGLRALQVSQGHADIAQEAPALGAQDGAVRKPRFEFGLGE